MYIQEPADKLAKSVGRPLRFKIGKRDATIFTKSTEYGKLIDNNHNDNLLQEEAKQAMRSAFVDKVKSGSKSEAGDVFDDAVDDPDITQQNIEATMMEIERLQNKREQQRKQSLQAVASQIVETVGSSSSIDKRLIEKAETGVKQKKIKKNW